MKKLLTITLSVICSCCCAFADGVADKYMDIACDWFSNRGKSEEQISKLKMLAVETTDPYDKAAWEELVFIYDDPKFKDTDFILLSCFVSGPVWQIRPKKEVVDSAFEANKTIMDIDLACDMAYLARNYGWFDGVFSCMSPEGIVLQKINSIDERINLRRKFLDTMGSKVKADPTAIDWMRSNMASIRRIFRAAERESAMVVSIIPSYQMRKFVWVVNLLGGGIKNLALTDYTIDWTDFNAIEDWFWINQYKLDSWMIENAQSLYTRLGLHLGEFNSNSYKKLLSDELYKEIVNQVAAKGIVPLQECDLSQFRK